MKELAIGETGEVCGKLVKCVEYKSCSQCAFSTCNCQSIHCTNDERDDVNYVMFLAVNHCTWTQDIDGIWHTSCGQAQEFTTGTREENGYKFCPYCGNEIKEESHDKE